MKHKPYVIQGNFSKDFLESMGLKKVEFPLFETSRNPSMGPLNAVDLAYKSPIRFENTGENWGRRPQRTSGLNWKKENRGD